MRQWILSFSCALGLAGLWCSADVQAYVTKPISIRQSMAQTPHIFLVKVDKLDPEKPSVTFRLTEDFKGIAPFQRLPVNLTADSEGQKDQHTAKLLKRLAPNLPVVIFAEKRGKRYTAFAFTNGTWFQMIGQAGDDDAVRWSFTHCEPYMRRAFKGSTEEMIEVVRDGLSGKKEPPPVDSKEPPGLGPEVKEEKKGPDKTAAGIANGQLFAVIPTFVILGPLALLATLFPAVFGGLALLMRRWLVLLTVASLDSTLFLAHGLLRGYLQDSWWGTPAALWSMLAFITLLGAFWSWWRQRASAEAVDIAPRRSEQIILWLVSLTGLAIVLGCLFKGTLSRPPWKELLVFWSVAWVGTFYTVYLQWTAGRRPKTRPATEGVMLWALVCACAGLGAASLPPKPTEGVDVVWRFEPPERGAILSSPVVSGDRVYVAAVHSSGFSSYGAVYCLDRHTNKLIWKFDDDGGMQQVFSTPCVADGKLFVGEGLHENRGSRFFCLDAGNGQKLWEFATTSHTESSPCVADGKVFFGAGDDGVYCLDAATGKKYWQYQEALHVDASPVVVGKHLYCGSGLSRTYKKTRIFCVQIDTGAVVWREDTALPVWGSPAADGKQVFFGLGNGRLDESVESPEKPAGAILCVDAATGQTLWQHQVGDGVLARPAVDGKHVYFTSRDHYCYCVDRKTGKPVWQYDLGSPSVAAPALLGPRLYAVASEGRVCCLDARKGAQIWSLDLAAYSQSQPQLYSSPAAAAEGAGQEAQRIYVGAALKDSLSSAAVLYCLQGSRRPEAALARTDGSQLE